MSTPTITIDPSFGFLDHAVSILSINFDSVAGSLPASVIVVLILVVVLGPPGKR